MKAICLRKKKEKSKWIKTVEMFLTMAEKKSYHIFNLYLKIVRSKHIAGVTTNDNKNTTETSSCK